MQSIITTYPDFHALPREVKKFLLESENYFFKEAHGHPIITMRVADLKTVTQSPQPPVLTIALPPQPIPQDSRRAAEFTPPLMKFGKPTWLHSAEGEMIVLFGGAVLVRQLDGTHNLSGGTPAERTAAKEWCERFIPEAMVERLGPLRRQINRSFQPHKH